MNFAGMANRAGTALKAALNSKDDDGQSAGSTDKNVARKVGTIARKGVRKLVGNKSSASSGGSKRQGSKQLAL